MKVAVATAWTFLIVVLCTIPGEDLPDVDAFSADKLGHFTMFAIVSWLWMWASPRAFRRLARTVAVAGLLFAGATEIYQGLLPFDREPSLADALANALGLLFGIWLYRRFRTSGSEMREKEFGSARAETSRPAR